MDVVPCGPLPLWDERMLLPEFVVWRAVNQLQGTWGSSYDDLPLPSLGFSNSFGSFVMQLQAHINCINHYCGDMIFSRQICNGDVISRDGKFFAAAASKGGVDIKIGSYTIHVPKYSSALVHMVHIARNLFGKTFGCLKSVVPKSIFSTDEFRPGRRSNDFSISFGRLSLHLFSLPLRFSTMWASVDAYWKILAGTRILPWNLDNTHREIKFSVRTALKGGLDIKIGSNTIHAPKYFSARHPLVKMVLFADKLHEDTFRCLKSVVPKGILDMVERSRSSTSQNVYEAGWVPAKPKPESQNAGICKATPVGSIGWSNEAQVPVLHGILAGTSETSGTTIARPLANSAEEGDDAAYYDAMGDVDHLPQGTTVNSIKMAQQITSSAHKDVHLGALEVREAVHEQYFLERAVHDHADTKPEQHSVSDPSDAAEHCTVKAEDKTAATWLIASAAPHHATGNSSLLTGFTPQAEDGLFVEAGDGAPMQVRGRGSVITDAVVLHDVWYVPGLTANLVSASQLTELDYTVGFARGACYIRSATDGNVVGKAGVGEDGLFELDFLKGPPFM